MRSCVFALFMILTVGVAGSTSYGVVELDVKVEGGSLADPIGACYGKWEGAEPLIINLSATDPKEIASADTYLPEDVIWNRRDASPDPWVFETASILPDEAFAVIFKGSLDSSGGGGGDGTPPDWVAAVSDIDLDCDSDNDSESTPPDTRDPEENEEEDALEFADSGASSAAPGMAMTAGAGWAKLVVKGHRKRLGLLSLQVEGDTSSFEIANDQYQVLTPPPEATTLRMYPEPGATVLYEEEIPAPDPPDSSYDRTFYIRPDTGANEDDQVVVTTVFAAETVPERTPGSQPATVPASMKAKDQNVINLKAWLLTAKNRIVMVDGYNNYATPADPKYNKAKPKELTVRGQPGQAFKLKRFWTPGSSARIRVFTDEQCQDQHEVAFDDTTHLSTTALSIEADKKVKALWIKGNKTPAGQPPVNQASTKYEDQELTLFVNGQPVGQAVKWTALWVEQSLRTAGDIPDDNMSVDHLYDECHTTTCGLVGEAPADGSKYGVRFLVQVKGTVTPSDLPSKYFKMRRRIKGARSYKNGTLDECASPKDDDIDDSNAKDENQKSNGSTNALYHSDAPGWKGTKSGKNVLLNAAVGTIVANRLNFFQWVELDKERCSRIMLWYAKRSGKKQPNGTWAVPNPALDNDDNSAGEGHKNLRYSAAQPVGLKLTVEANQTYAPAGNLNGVFTGTALPNNVPNYTFGWVLDVPQAQWVDGPKAGNVSVWNKAIALGNTKGRHQILCSVEDGQQRLAITRLIVYTNKPPVVRLKGNWDKLKAQFTVSATDSYDPEKNENNDTIKRVPWTILFQNNVGQDLDGSFSDKEGLLRGHIKRAVPANTAWILVICVCYDKRNASAGYMYIYR